MHQNPKPRRQITDVPSPGKLYSQLMNLIVRFAHAGLIHGDFNEFNILIKRSTGDPVVIDFPQMVSTSHENAEWLVVSRPDYPSSNGLRYFNRDVECIRTFFRRRFRYESALYPRFKSIMSEDGVATGEFRLDVMVAASGFKQKDMKALEDVRYPFSILHVADACIVYGCCQRTRTGRREREQ